MELRIYRAIISVDGQWVYGIPHCSAIGNWFMCDSEHWEPHPIRKETIGQDTGIRDRDGQPIFEGDLIRIGRCSLLFEVRFNPRLARYQAVAQGSPVVRDLKAMNQKSYETISNLWESASNAAGAPSTAAAEERPNTGAPSGERASAV